MINILIVDDEKNQRDVLMGFLVKKGYHALACGSGKEALSLVRGERIDMILTDYQMPEMTGQELLEEVKRINPSILVIIFTAYGTIDRAVAAMKAGAYDYLTKPIDLNELLIIIQKGVEYLHLIEENRELREMLSQRYSFDNIISVSDKMEEILNLVSRVAKTDITVLIRGESGTGKELIAHAIHFNSSRAERPFIKVNCAALPENLLESELFGHEKGSFTGAIQRRIGRFEEADSGSIFLDEIGDLSHPLQVKLLRVLQEREIQRVGANASLRVDVRVIAATNKDLEKGMMEGHFREDLYYRLNVVPIFLPPLRERREDIPRLIEFFLQRHSEKCKKKVKGVTKEVLDALLKYHYPGNVRELENIIERATVLTRYEYITLADLPPNIYAHQSHMSEADLLPTTAHSLDDAVSALEKKLITKALALHDGVQTKAAESLGISERVLRYKMKKYGLSLSH
ncbi:MAG: sigma-54 dependent transcriptional regulator [bacterium]|nr:sigma-54 dependent transcriptional regulator [bacterium]